MRLPPLLERCLDDLALDRATLRLAWQDGDTLACDTLRGLATGPLGPGRLDVDDRDVGVARRWRLTLDLDRQVTWQTAVLELPLDTQAIAAVLTQGFQSWTETTERPLEARLPRMSALMRPLAAPYGELPVFAGSGEPGRLHGFAYTWLRHEDDRVTLVGSLAEHEAHTVLEVDAPAGVLRLHRDLEGWRTAAPTTLFDVLWVGPTRPQEAMSAYLDALGLPSGLGRQALAGWTSWYYHYTRISEAVILDQLDAWTQADVPLDVFQIDDGYQRAIGDWLEPRATFPNGMRPIAEAIKARGLRPGLWLAPFVCVPRSRLYREHPEWLARDPRGRPLRAGINPLWKSAFYALDVLHPGFREHLRAVLETLVDDWGFELLKLDFLFAAGLAPLHGLPRAAVLTAGLDLLRESARGAQLLGCGVPIGQALGRFDLCRVGADVHERWEARGLERLGVAERLSTVSALRSTLSRALLGGRAFGNDPDVFMLRQERCRLSRAEQRTLLLVNVLCGQVLFTSDDVRRYDEPALRLLRAAFPLPAVRLLDVRQRGDAYQVRARAWERTFLALINLGDRVASFAVDGPHFDPDQRDVRPAGSRQVEARSAVVLAPLRPWDSPCILGGDGHLLPGADVADVRLVGEALSLVRRPGSQGNTRVWIGLPPGVTEVRWGSERLEARPTPWGAVVAVELSDS